jgi:hypothetical protein
MVGAGSGNDNGKHSPRSFALFLSRQCVELLVDVPSHRFRKSRLGGPIVQFCSGGHLFSSNTISYIANVRQRVSLKHLWVLRPFFYQEVGT